jgi:gas vesicle protein
MAKAKKKKAVTKKKTLKHLKPGKTKTLAKKGKAKSRKDAAKKRAVKTKKLKKQSVDDAMEIISGETDGSGAFVETLSDQVDDMAADVNDEMDPDAKVADDMAKEETEDEEGFF